MVTIRVGVVGCGHISTVHLRGWRRARASRVTGVFDTDRDLARRRGRRFGVGVYDDLDALLEGCDLVDVCTPPDSHFEIARRAIAAGRHLLIEKPVVTDLGQWEALRGLLAGSQSTLTAVHNLKFARSILAAKRWVDDGRIGSIVRLERRFLTSPESDRMLRGPGHWSHRLPGGRWFETLPHELYLIHHFLGPVELRSVLALRGPEAPAAKAADEVMVGLAGESCFATLDFSARCRLNLRQLAIYGSDGAIDVDLPSDGSRLLTVRDRRWLRPVGRPGLETLRFGIRWWADRARYLGDRLTGTTPHVRLIRALEAFLVGRGDPPTPLDEIDFVVRLGDRIARAIDGSASDDGASRCGESIS